MHEVTFDQIAEFYDDSREVPDKVIQQLLGCLKDAGIFQKNQTLIDVACGTGRYLKAFASFFLHAIGLDISKEMIDVAKRKCGSIGDLQFIIGDARAMNIPDAVADVVISSKLFIHVREWKKIIAEINRISREGAFFIYVNETGLFNNNVRKKFRELSNQSRMKFGFLGEVDLEKIGLSFEEAGYRRICFTCRGLGWTHRIKYADVYDALRKRSFAEFQQINDRDYQEILDNTAEWIHKQPRGWNEIQEMQPKLRVDVFRKTTKQGNAEKKLTRKERC